MCCKSPHVSWTELQFNIVSLFTIPVDKIYAIKIKLFYLVKLFANQMKCSLYRLICKKKKKSVELTSGSSPLDPSSAHINWKKTNNNFPFFCKHHVLHT